MRLEHRVKIDIYGLMECFSISMALAMEISAVLRSAIDSVLLWHLFHRSYSSKHGYTHISLIDARRENEKKSIKYE